MGLFGAKGVFVKVCGCSGLPAQLLAMWNVYGRCGTAEDMLLHVFLSGCRARALLERLRDVGSLMLGKLELVSKRETRSLDRHHAQCGILRKSRLQHDTKFRKRNYEYMARITTFYFVFFFFDFFFLLLDGPSGTTTPEGADPSVTMNASPVKSAV